MRRMVERTGIVDSAILEVIGADGRVKQRVETMVSEKYNSITYAGMAEVAGLILTDVGGTAFDYVGIGTSSIAEDPAQTDLQSPLKRKAGTGTRVTTSVTNDTAQLVATFSSADGLSGTSTICEVGMFNAATAGTMLFRKVVPGVTVNWDAGEQLAVTLKCQIKQGT